MTIVERQLVVEDALSAGARAVILDPESLESLDAAQLMQLGRELRRRAPELALRSHELAAQRSTGKARGAALVSLAATQRANGMPETALDSLAEALEFDDSPHTALAANTCRVAALRDVGELKPARSLGEELQHRYPDDSKVLRALAAVYAEMSESEAANKLFALANELETVPHDDFGFADLNNATPQLEALLDRAAATVDPGEPTFCAFEVWTKAFRPILEDIAGSQRADPRLRSERAFSLIALLAYHRLPPCRDCGRIYTA